MPLFFHIELQDTQILCVNYINSCRQKLKALHDANISLGAVSGVNVCFLLFSFLTKHCMHFSTDSTRFDMDPKHQYQTASHDYLKSVILIKAFWVSIKNDITKSQQMPTIRSHISIRYFLVPQ